MLTLTLTDCADTDRLTHGGIFNATPPHTGMHSYADRLTLGADTDTDRLTLGADTDRLTLVLTLTDLPLVLTLTLTW